MKYVSQNINYKNRTHFDDLQKAVKVLIVFHI